MHTLLTEEEWRSGERCRVGAGRRHFEDGKAEGRRELIAEARIVKRALIAELRKWQRDRLDELTEIGKEAGPAATGERYGMQRLARKLDEMEAAG